MKSRYDYMEESRIQDPEDNDFYADVLTLSYDRGILTQIPTMHRVTGPDLCKFWKLMYDKYNVAEMDDVLLNINGFPYLGMLKPGDELYLVKDSDLDGYVTSRRTGEDPD